LSLLLVSLLSLCLFPVLSFLDIPSLSGTPFLCPSFGGISGKGRREEKEGREEEGIARKGKEGKRVMTP